MKVSQQNIAERLNVSISTVSRALRNDDSILPTTRAKIFKTASEMGYRPKLKRVHERVGDATVTQPVIGVYAHEPRAGSWTNSESRGAGHYMLSGISAAAATLGAQIYFQSVHDGEVEQIFGDKGGAPSRLRERECSGALLLYLHEPAAVQQLTGHFPCVSLVNRYTAADTDTVGVDAHQSLGDLIGRLVDHGHHRIGFFNGRSRGPWVGERFAAYVNVMMRYGLGFDPEIVKGVYDHERLSVKQARESLFAATRQGVTAWVCSHDDTGYKVCRALREEGFDVPGDVSVVGFDGVAAPQGEPALGTVLSPLEELGQAGVVRLLSRIKDPTMATRTVLLKSRITEGQTVGPAPRR